MVRIANPRYSSDQAIVSNAKGALKIMPDLVSGRLPQIKQTFRKKVTNINKPQLYDGEATDAFIGFLAQDVYDGFITISDTLTKAFNDVLSGNIQQGDFIHHYNDWVNEDLIQLTALIKPIDTVDTVDTQPETIIHEVIQPEHYTVKNQSGLLRYVFVSKSGKDQLTNLGWHEWRKFGSKIQAELYIESLTPEPIPEPIPEPTPEPIPEPTPEPIPEPTPEIDISITDNMIIQRLDSFSIVNGRAIGQITFTATDSFNPYYYNKNITNIIQFKTPNGVNILPFVKQNTLRFTATERTETIQYNEGMNDNTRANVESFVWSGVTQPTPFSKQLKFEIVTAQEGQPALVPTVQTSGFMGAGVAGAIASLILIGFIADHKRGK